MRNKVRASAVITLAILFLGMLWEILHRASTSPVMGGYFILAVFAVAILVYALLRPRSIKSVYGL